MSRRLLLIFLVFLWFIRIPVALRGDFVDFTIEAGVTGTGVGNGIAIGDYDNDGYLDIYVSADPHDILYRNNGDGTFQDVTDKTGIFVRDDGVGAVFGDYDNDGDLDLYIPVNDGPDVFFQNEGNGVFRNITRAIGINNPHRARSASFVDFDNDGFLDIYVVNENAPNILYKNKNGVSFEDVALKLNVAHPGPGRAGIWGDYDNDGDLDLFLTNRGAPNVLYRNDGFTFTDVTKRAGLDDSGNSTGAVFGDYDNDGYLDICVCGRNKVWLYRNNRDGSFTDVSEIAGLEILGEFGTPAFGDYDNDGNLDLYLAVWSGDSVIYRNTGQGTFENVTQELGMGVFGNSWGVVFADFDNDGDLDIYTTYTTRNNILYKNNGNDNNWLHVKTVGGTSNRDGIGSRIKLITGGVSQIREVGGGTGYGSQESLQVEFGMGDFTFADLLEIKWTSGMVTTLNKVKGNQLITVMENFWSVEDMNIEYGESKKQDSKITKSCILPNYPNPFNPETWLPYQLSEQTEVNINIYDSNGRLIRAIHLGIKLPGVYASKDKAAYWNGRNEYGELVAPGIYFYSFRGKNFLQLGKLILK